METSKAEVEEAAVDAEAVRAFLIANPELITADEALMEALGVRPRPANVVDFGPAAMARVHAERRQESAVRQRLEETARANFAAQAQTHGAVVDLLDARNHADLAWRLDQLAQQRFGLVGAVVCLEDPGHSPAGWRLLAEGQVDLLLGEDAPARMGFTPTALPMFAERAEAILSMALVRLSIWEPSRQGLLAFGSADANGFTEDMGAELVSFLARVVERTAERWPVL